MAGRHRLAVSLMAVHRLWPLATIRLDGREMGRALMARLLGGDGHGDYVAPVELVERASLQAPRIPVNPLFTPLSAATR